MTPKGTILVAEDDRKTAELLRLYLVAAGYGVLLAADGPSALREARASSPDLVVLDWMLPGASGVSVCRSLRAESDVPVIFLTARVDEEDRLGGLAAGGDDYVTKPFSPREIVARVRAVLRRTAPRRGLSGERRCADLVVDGERREARLGEARLDLTPTEFRLLEVLIGSPGRPFSRRELAERALREESEALERTIDAHVMKLRRKMRRASRHPVAKVETVFGVGYRLTAGDA